jgi:hypothetical protein
VLDGSEEEVHGDTGLLRLPWQRRRGSWRRCR